MWELHSSATLGDLKETAPLARWLDHLENSSGTHSCLVCFHPPDNRNMYLIYLELLSLAWESLLIFSRFFIWVIFWFSCL